MIEPIEVRTSDLGYATQIINDLIDLENKKISKKRYLFIKRGFIL